MDPHAFLGGNNSSEDTDRNGGGCVFGCVWVVGMMVAVTAGGMIAQEVWNFSTFAIISVVLPSVLY